MKEFGRSPADLLISDFGFWISDFLLGHNGIPGECARELKTQNSKLKTETKAT
jgi:hypothetical protein